MENSLSDSDDGGEKLRSSSVDGESSGDYQYVGIDPQAILNNRSSDDLTSELPESNLQMRHESQADVDDTLDDKAEDLVPKVYIAMKTLTPPANTQRYIYVLNIPDYIH